MSALTDHEYVGKISGRLRNFKKKSARLYNFSCPLCGDSSRDKTKARGFIYEGSGGRLFFKCHNCQMSMRLGGFIDRLDAGLAAQYRMDTFGERERASLAPKHEDPKRELKPEEGYPDPLSEYAVSISALYARGKPHPALDYIQRRRVPPMWWNDLYHIERMSSLEPMLPAAYAEKLPADSRILVPHRHIDGRLVGIAGRALNPNAGLRYVTARMIDDLPMICGLDRISKTGNTYLVEGPFDAMQVHNCCAASGADFTKALEFIKDPIVAFDNEPRNPTIVRLMSTLAAGGLRVVVWPDSWPYKDIAEAAEAGLDPEQIEATLNSNARRGLALTLAMVAWHRSAGHTRSKGTRRGGKNRVDQNDGAR